MLKQAETKNKRKSVFSVLLFSITAGIISVTFMVGCSSSPGISIKATAGSSGICVQSQSNAESSETQLDRFLSYVQNHGYTVLANSPIGGFVRLPDKFSGTKDGFDIGGFLKERNALSKQNGFDFSDYAGKVLAVYSCDAEKRRPGDSKISEIAGSADTICLIGLYNGDKMVGFWPYSHSGKRDDFSVLQTYLNEKSN